MLGRKPLDKRLTEAGFERIFCPNCQKETIAYGHDKSLTFLAYPTPGEEREEYKRKARCLACLGNLEWVPRRSGYYKEEATKDA